MRSLAGKSIRMGAAVVAMILGSSACQGGNGKDDVVSTPSVDVDVTFNPSLDVDVISTLDDLYSLNLSIEGGEWEEWGESPVEAGAIIEELPEATEGLSPIECGDLTLIRTLVTSADVGSQDPVSVLGVIRVTSSSNSNAALVVGVTARVFDEPTDATGFLGAVREAARACPNGFTKDLWACEECQTFDGVVGVAAVGAVSVTAGTKRGGGSWVLVEVRAMESWSGDYGQMYDDSILFFAYGNVVVAIDNPFDGQYLLSLPSADRDSLVQQIVDQLGG